MRRKALSYGFLLPRPLTGRKTRHPDVDALRSPPGSAAFERAAARLRGRPSPEDLPALLAALSDKVLDCGRIFHDPKLEQSLEPDERRAYLEAHNRTYDARTGRLQYLLALMSALAEHDAGEPRLVEIVSGAKDPDVRVHAAGALLHAARAPGRETLEAVGRCIDLSGEPYNCGMHGLREVGVAALVRLGADEAFVRLAACFAPAKTRTWNGRLRAIGILAGLTRLGEAGETIDPRWTDVLASLPANEPLFKVVPAAMWFDVAIRLPPDPRLAPLARRLLAAEAARGGAYDHRGLCILAESGDRDALPLLGDALRASLEERCSFDVPLGGIVRLDDPASMPVLRGCLEAARAGSRPERVARLEAALAGFVARHGEPAKPTGTAGPRRRPPRKPPPPRGT